MKVAPFYKEQSWTQRGKGTAMKSNEKLQRDVLEQLDWDTGIDASQIGVTTHDGVVTLTGHVSTHTDRHTAEKLTKRVHGVKAVANDIEVRPQDSHQRDDEHIAAAAVHALAWDGKVPDDRVQVVVRDGWITLEGAAEHRFEREAAERAVRHLIGVRGVTNSIVVEPAETSVAERKTVSQIKSEIEGALRRSAILNSKQITTEVNEHAVILTGDVHSHKEIDEVERIAWTAREVSQVENCITITPWGSGPMEEWGY
jgi:osmotically-inducible protein OsmY